MKGAHYEMVIIHDPSGIFPDGARLPLQEFLIGLEMGNFSEGMKVSKRAVTSEFSVGKDTKGKPALVDIHNRTWSPRTAGRYYQLRRTNWRRRK
jgi:hypothetical protein